MHKFRFDTGLKNYAFAPYNFVRLNHSCVLTDATEKHEQRDAFYGNSGYIDLSIENLSPFFIRGLNENFFKTGCNGKISIPGSSLRGLVRTVVEVISYGKFGAFKDKHLFFRKRGEARDRQLGFLIEKDGQLLIYKAKYNAIPHKLSNAANEFSYFFKAEGDNLFIEINSGIISGNRNFKVVYAASETFYQVPKKVSENYLDDKTINVSGTMSKIVEIAEKGSIETMVRNANHFPHVKFIGVPVWYTESGGLISHFGHCKNYRIPYSRSIGSFIPKQINPNVPENFKKIDIASSLFGYENIEDRGAGKLFFEDLEIKHDNGYEEAILQILASPKPNSAKLYLSPQERAAVKDWNSNTTIRGNKLYWNRLNDLTEYCILQWRKFVFRKKEVSDIFKVEESNIESLLANGLIERHEISADHFIVNYSMLSATIKSRLKNEIFATVKRIHQFTIAKVLNPGCKFEGRIRFENLTDVELGSLLKALKLPDNCAHKIGMGKPIGLGTIKIDVELKLIVRRERYSSFCLNEFLSQSCVTTTDYIYIKKFEEYILSKLNIEDFGLNRNRNGSIFDELPRILDLFGILSLNEKLNIQDKFLDRTRYMEIENPESGNREYSNNCYLKDAIFYKP